MATAPPQTTNTAKRKREEESWTSPTQFTFQLDPLERPLDDSDEDEVQIVDPVRAALTWHEDEITIYDPEDEDDDGVGINGIGFKPTPALAQARAKKRKQ
ncbi:unnamed protein product [Fusarium langsethiae]|nr:unnamed protein product [Fusarium langsethiae]